MTLLSGGTLENEPGFIGDDAIDKSLRFVVIFW